MTVRALGRRKRAAHILALAGLLLFAVVVLNFGAHQGGVAHAAMLQESHASGEGHAAESQGTEHKESSEENEAEAFKHSPSVQFVANVTGLSLENAYWLCVLLNFAVIAGLIFWFSRKNLPGMFRNRTASIQKAMEEARKASEDANRRLSDIESRLARLDGEISEMRGAAEMEAVAEEERIKAATQEDIKKVVQSAEQEIEAAAKNVRRELKAFAADLVVSLAEKQIQVDTSTDQALVRGFANQLSSDGQRGRN